jgi:hypothetical protein
VSARPEARRAAERGGRPKRFPAPPRARKNAGLVAEPCYTILAEVWRYPAAVPDRDSMLPDRDSIMTPRIHGARPGSTVVEIWISKPPSYTMLPAHARVGATRLPKGLSVARGPQGGCVPPPQPPGEPDVARQHPNCGAAPAIHRSITPIAAAKFLRRMSLLIFIRPARLLRLNSVPTTPPSPHPGFPHGESR